MAKKHVDHTINFTKENGNTAVAEVLMDGKVDVTINTPSNVTVIRHFADVTDMNNEMNSLGYKAV